ncbi:MAG: LysR family transcriptional regulator [Clostridia bacterium]|nr:LysR family transcriptional regulator [Clostridia bacterium]
MNLRQIEYFLTVAQCLSFSEAAKRLYMTQPALGRQIRVLEEEMGVLLFVRGKRSLSMTPGGKLLYEELGDWIQAYNKFVERAQQANSEITDRLSIGLLEGHQLGNLFPEIYDAFISRHPHIRVRTHRTSFSPLIEELYQGESDVIITLDFDVKGRADIECRRIAGVRNFLVVPADHPLADKEGVTLYDFRDDVIIVNSPEDSRAGYNNLMSACRDAGFEPKARQAASFEEYMLMLELGNGITVLSEHNMLKLSPRLKFIRIPNVTDVHLVLCWLRGASNPAAMQFIRVTDQILEKHAASSASALSPAP